MAHFQQHFPLAGEEHENNAAVPQAEPLPSVEETIVRLRSLDERERHQAAQTVRELCLPKTPHCVENRREVGDHGGIELLVEMLDSRNSDVQRSTCLALNEACLKNPVNSRTFQSCGAIPRVMRVLESGDPDLQTQALAVLGTSAVNAVEVRRGLKEAGAVPLLVSLLGSKTAGVQEWAAYALRKASSKASDVDLANAMIAEAIQSGADRKLVEMCQLRSQDAQEEAQQTLDYFEVDQEKVQAIMEREENTKPLVALQRLCWMAVYHPRLGQGSSARRLPLELVDLIARKTADAATEDVVERWNQQGLAWVDSLNWQQRALEAEARVGAITVRLAELNTAVEEITRRDSSLRAVEERVGHLEKQLAQAEVFVARAVGSRSALQAMQADVTDLVERLGERLNFSALTAAGGVDDAAGESTEWHALPAPPSAGPEGAPGREQLIGGRGPNDGSTTAAGAAAVAMMPTKTELQQSASKSTATPERMDALAPPRSGGALTRGLGLGIGGTAGRELPGVTGAGAASGGQNDLDLAVATPGVVDATLRPPSAMSPAVDTAQPTKADAASPMLHPHHTAVGRGK